MSANKKSIVVGMSTCNVAAGADEVLKIIQDRVKAGLDVDLSITGCLGMCYCEPQVKVIDEDGREHLYIRVDAGRMEKILNDHVESGKPQVKWTLDFAEAIGKQRRIVLANCGKIDPERLGDYLARDGYKALEKVLKDNQPAAVIQEVQDSGLRGRGGGGFSTGLKWRFAFNNKADKKYVVCNADEGDPGAFMDRTTLESDPHAVLEGMAIGAFATGADEAYVYCRAEYPLAIKRLNRAIAQAEEKGYLGKNIFGTSFNFEVHVKEGAGAFVCGEETALLASIEGPPGYAEHQAAVSCRVRPVRQTDHYQQRRNLGQRPLDYPSRRPGLCRLRYGKIEGHQGFCPCRQDQARRSGGGAHGHHPG